MFSSSLEEIPEGRSLFRDNSLIVRDGFENLEVPFQIRVNGHDRSYVSTTITIIGGRPDSYQLVIEHKLVSFLDELMGTRH